MFYGKLTRTTILKILSVSLLTTKEHPCKVKKNLQGSFFIIYENSKIDFFINYSTLAPHIDWTEVFHEKNRYYITRLIYQEAFTYESSFDRSQETVIVRKIRTQGSLSVERKKKGKHIVCLKLITENVPVN